MNSYERSRRNHPAQIAKDKRTLEMMEKTFLITAPEVTYPKRRKRRRKQLQQARKRFAMMWRY